MYSYVVVCKLFNIALSSLTEAIWGSGSALSRPSIVVFKGWVPWRGKVGDEEEGREGERGWVDTPIFETWLHPCQKLSIRILHVTFVIEYSKLLRWRRQLSGHAVQDYIHPFLLLRVGDCPLVVMGGEPVSLGEIRQRWSSVCNVATEQDDKRRPVSSQMCVTVQSSMSISLSGV